LVTFSSSISIVAPNAPARAYSRTGRPGPDRRLPRIRATDGNIMGRCLRPPQARVLSVVRGSLPRTARAPLNTGTRSRAEGDKRIDLEALAAPSIYCGMASQRGQTTRPQMSKSLVKNPRASRHRTCRRMRHSPPAAATDRDQGTPGQRIPSGLGGVDERADRRSCAAEALVET
jgi:hypothetical protein